jgi:competence protein ComEC
VAVLTHGDRDHCRGLYELAGYLAVGEVWLAPAAARSACGRSLLALPGIHLRPLWAGEVAVWRGWRFAVLNPLAGERGGNERSLVLRGESRGRSLMLTGDIGHRTEFRILQRAAPGQLRSDLLKVAHHGSAGSSSLSFLQAVDPVLALASAGRGNPFGHPARRVVERFADLGIPLLRTDLTGQVEVAWSSGGRLAIRSWGPAGNP